MWIRDFTKQGIRPQSLDFLFEDSEYDVVLENEVANKQYGKISKEEVNMSKVVIVSDGYNFNWKHLSISKFENVAVLAVNRAMKNWKLMLPSLTQEEQKPINAYVANNPYQECMRYLPPTETPYYPVCISSTRTNYMFLEKYLGDKFTYEPTPDTKFGSEKMEGYCIDDYRNPVCAAIGLAYQFGAQKIMLLSCDSSFVKERDFSVPLENGLWTYPQNIQSQEIIDANLYWLTHQENREVQIADWSDGPKYVNASYIKNEEEAVEFFAEEGN